MAFAIEQEMALTLCDLLIRRTSVGALGIPTDEALSRVIGLASRRLSWDAARARKEREFYLAKVQGQPEGFQPGKH